MKCLLHISYDDTAAPVQITKYLVSLDRALISQMGQERPIDILMEILATVELPRSARDFIKPIEDLCQNGRAHLRGAVLPGACRYLRMDPYLEVDVDHLIYISILQPNKDWNPQVSIKLDDAEPLDFSRHTFHQSPERSGATHQAIFGEAYVSRYQDEIRPEQVAAGSVLAGFCDALFSEEGEHSRDAFRKGHALLAGAIAAIAGASFSDWTNRSNIEWAISASSEQYENFIRNGHLVSNRGWNPTTFLAGPRLSEATSEADPALLETGREIYRTIRDLDDLTARLVLVSLIEEADCSLSQVETYIKATIPRDESNHARLERTGHARRITEVISRIASDLTKQSHSPEDQT
jgi:hypothetical protein